MSWRSTFDNAYEEDEEEDDQYSRPTSLRQTLLSAAQRWETERERAEKSLRDQIVEERRKFNQEARLLKAERAKCATLEQTLREETAKTAAEASRAKGLQEELAGCKAQALGSYLMLASIRTKLEALPTCLEATQRSELACDLPQSNGAPLSPMAQGEEAANENTAAGEDAASQLTRAQKKKLKDRAKAKEKKRVAGTSDGADGAEVEGDDNGDEEGEAVESWPADGADGQVVAMAARGAGTPESEPVASQVAFVMARCINLLDELSAVPALPSVDDFISSCREGKFKAVEKGLTPPGIGEVLAAKAEQVLCDGLEASVAGGHQRIVQKLIDGGADAQRTSALHIAIRHGHTALMAHLITSANLSVNARDEEGASPLHIAAEFNQPKAAQYLLKHSAFVDATDADGRTPMQVAEAFKWKEMQRVLREPSLLFWNRAARANKLYKAGEFEPACEGYALAEVEMDRMHSPPAADNVATFFFNYGRSCQGMGSFCKALRLFNRVLEASPSHERALDHRAECHNALGDSENALVDLAELQKSFKGAEEATTKAWARRAAAIKAEKGRPAHEVLGISADASEAELRKAYRQLCLNWHPDKHASSAEDQRERARHKFARIQAAYERLHGSQSMRSHYRESWSRYGEQY